MVQSVEQSESPSRSTLATAGGGGTIGGMLSPEDEARAVTEVAQRLSATFPDLAPSVVHDTVHQSYERFSGSPIRDFVPVLVERMARTTLVTRPPSL